MVGQLGQHLGGGDADTDRHPHPLLDTLADGLPGVGEVARHTLQIEKAFIDAVHLLARTEVSQHRHDAIGHIRIQGIVGGERDDAVFPGKAGELKPRFPHRDAQCFNFKVIWN
jgi:hypothetical protein